MTGTIFTRISGWWARLFRRRGTLPAPPAVRWAADPSVIMPNPAENADAPPAAAPSRRKRRRGGSRAEKLSDPVIPAPSVNAAEDTEQSLRETLGVSALPISTLPNDSQRQLRQCTLDALGNLRQIPALQSLAQGFLQAMNRPEVAVDEVVDSISKDSALCVRVLRMANSVLISPERRIEDLESAVQMLGVMRVRKAAQALFTLRDAKRVAEGFDWRHLWIHALGTAAIAEELERRLRSIENSQIHLAALLHDVGKIVLSTVAPEVYRDVLVHAWHKGGRLEELERDRLGVDHREAGVLFARHNGMPELVVQSIAHHAGPEGADSHRFEVALVTISNYISKAHGLGFSGARLDAADGDLENLPAWRVVEEECGFRPDCAELEAELRPYLAELRSELRMLREST